MNLSEICPFYASGMGKAKGYQLTAVVPGIRPIVVSQMRHRLFSRSVYEFSRIAYCGQA